MAFPPLSEGRDPERRSGFQVAVVAAFRFSRMLPFERLNDGGDVLGRVAAAPRRGNIDQPALAFAEVARCQAARDQTVTERIR
jgi:hypothetical protein